MGFYTVDIDYRQPPLGAPTAVPDSPGLCLMYKSSAAIRTAVAFGVDLLAAVRNILADVYLSDAPDRSPFYSHIERQVAGFTAAWFASAELSDRRRRAPRAWHKKMRPAEATAMPNPNRIV